MTDVITEAQLRAIMPNAGAHLTPLLPQFNPALVKAGITTARRAAAFVAEIAEESGECHFLEEIASGDEYEGRADLGNIYPGDGRRFKGRSLIQVTGRNNYTYCGHYLNEDFVSNPPLLAAPMYATAGATWFWTHGSNCDLSLLADMDWIVLISKWINGGTNGLEQRIKYWDVGRQVLGLPFVDATRETESIMAFQRAKGLVADGVVGPKTIAALQAGHLAATSTPKSALKWWPL